MNAAFNNPSTSLLYQAVMKNHAVVKCSYTLHSQLALQEWWNWKNATLKRAYSPVVFWVSSDFPLYVLNRLSVAYFVFPSFAFVLWPDFSDISLETHRVWYLPFTPQNLPVKKNNRKVKQFEYEPTLKSEFTGQKWTAYLTPLALFHLSILQDAKECINSRNLILT